MALSSGEPRPTSPEAPQAASWPPIQPGTKHFAPSRHRSGQKAARTLGMLSDPVSQEIRQGERHFAGRKGEPLHGLPAQQRSAVARDHGRLDRRAWSPSPFGASINHLRPWHRVHRLALPSGRPRRSDVVLRSASTVAERHGGKHQPPRSQMAPERHRSIVDRASRPAPDMRPSQLDTPQMPRLQNTGRSLPSEDTVGQSMNALTCLAAESHFSWNSQVI